MEGFPDAGIKIVRAGASAYAMVCTPETVKYRETTTCYQEIPIWYKNESMYADALTFIIKVNGSRCSCSQRYPIKYRLGQEDPDWWCSTPSIRMCGPKEIPEKLRPGLSEFKNYSEDLRFETLGYRGYNSEQLEQHRNWSVFYDVVVATLDVVGSGPMGDKSNGFGVSITDIFPSETLEDMGNLFSTQWLGFLTRLFGNPIENLMEAEMATKLISYFLGGLVAAIVTYNTYGMCLRVFVAIFKPPYYLLTNPIWLALHAERLHEIVENNGYPCPVHGIAKKASKRDMKKGIRRYLSDGMKRMIFGRRVQPDDSLVFEKDCQELETVIENKYEELPQAPPQPLPGAPLPSPPMGKALYPDLIHAGGRRKSNSLGSVHYDNTPTRDAPKVAPSKSKDDEE